MISKNRKRLFRLLVPMLVLFGMSTDAMEKKSIETPETNKNSGNQSYDHKNEISLARFGCEIEKRKGINSYSKTKFDLKLLKKMYEKSKENIKNKGEANVNLGHCKIFLTPKYPEKTILINKYKDFDISFEEPKFVSPISDKEIDNDPSKVDCETYFTWKNQRILSTIYSMILVGGISDEDGIKFIKDNVLVHHGKWGMCEKFCLFVINANPAKFEKDTKEPDLAQSYDDLIKYCDKAIKKLNDKQMADKLGFEVIE